MEKSISARKTPINVIIKRRGREFI